MQYVTTVRSKHAAIFGLAWLIGAAACSSESGSSPPSSNGGTSGALPSSPAGNSGASVGVTNSSSGNEPTSGSGGASAGVAGTSSGGTTQGGAGGPTAASGSGGTSSAGTGGVGDVESPPGFFTDGFLKREPWQGYVFTIADKLGSTVSPVCDTTGCTPAWGPQPCAKGTVAKHAMSGSFAGLAFHAIDPVGGPRGVWLANGTGIYVSVKNPPASARLQLQQKAASNDTRYCAPLPPGGTGTIPFAEFKTYCWGDAAHPSKSFTVGTDVHEVTVIVPGSSTADQPFDFCLADIQPR